MNSIERMLTRLPENYAQEIDSNLAKLLSLPAAQIDNLMSTFQRISLWRDLNEAQGATLDQVGDSIQQPRGQMNDEIYRVLIKSKILRNLSHGTVSDIIRILTVAFGIKAEDVFIASRWDQGDLATVAVQVPIGSLASAGLTLTQFAQLCQSVLAAGVLAVPLAGGTFVFSSQPNAVEVDATAGFINANPSTGEAIDPGPGLGGTLGGTYDTSSSYILPI